MNTSLSFGKEHSLLISLEFDSVVFMYNYWRIDGWL